jgi:flagellar biosynthetic protein FliP
MAEVIPALAIVLGALVVLRVGLEFTGLRSARQRRALRVLDTCPLGGKRRIHLLEVEGERLVVGVSEAGVELLRVLPPAEEEPSSADAEAEAGANGTRSGSDRIVAKRKLAAILRTAVGTLWLALLLLGFDSAPATAQEAGIQDAAIQQTVTTPSLTISLGDASAPEGVSGTLQVLALLTLLSVAPSLLLMATCFTRVVIVLAFLRQAIGVQHLPPNQVLVGLALFTTLFVMAPIGEQIRVDAYAPYAAREIPAEEAAKRAVVPVRRFLSDFTRERDLALFLDFADLEAPEDLADVPLTTLLPAYMLSELRTAFEIGFMIYLPFLVVDLVIASMLISMGMIVLPPIVISLPFKLMLFVLLDGWNLVLGSLMAGLR